MLSDDVKAIGLDQAFPQKAMQSRKPTISRIWFDGPARNTRSSHGRSHSALHAKAEGCGPLTLPSPNPSTVTSDLHVSLPEAESSSSQPHGPHELSSKQTTANGGQVHSANGMVPCNGMDLVEKVIQASARSINEQSPKRKGRRSRVNVEMDVPNTQQEAQSSGDTCSQQAGCASANGVHGLECKGVGDGSSPEFFEDDVSSVSHISYGCNDTSVCAPRSESSFSVCSERMLLHDASSSPVKLKGPRKRNRQPQECNAQGNQKQRRSHHKTLPAHLYIPRPPPALPGLAAPEPGEVPLALLSPIAHPLPAGVSALCHSKTDGLAARWARILDHFKLCGGRWLYYVHYAGGDRRFDEWADQERLELSTATFDPPADMDENPPQARSILDQRFSEILQRTEKHMQYHPSDYAQSLVTKMKTVDSIRYGQYEIDCWYFSPYPVDPQESGRHLFICEYCMKYMTSYYAWEKHYSKCLYRHPPGDEIYRDQAKGISVFEVSGRTDRLYCQNLCLFAKLFLDHKTMHYDVQHFLFYILCEIDSGGGGCRMVGYFSKEKVDCYNLACLLIVPPHQRKGYGRFLIEMSYELSRKEGRPGTPERPLSDLGRVSYFSYWKDSLLREVLRREGETCSIKALSAATAIRSDDILHTLQALNCIHSPEGGAHTVIKVPPRLREEFLRQCQQPRLQLDRSNLHYCPASQPKRSELRDRTADGKT